MRLIGCLLAAACCAPLSGASPVLTDLQPHGAQRGKAIAIALSGSGLSEGATVRSNLPAAFTPLAPKQGRMGEGQINFLVELKPDAPIGLYPIRVETPEGLSNILLFSVGAFPEVSEEESLGGMYLNDSPDKAQAVPIPVTINGTLRGPDQDFYRFHARAGERLVFEVEARRAGSAIDPVVQILDGAGKELAFNDDAPGIGVDARVEAAFPEEGDYYVAVHDSKFSAQSQNFYRLKIGAYAYADGIFPMGWKRGGDVAVELFGGNLPAPVQVHPNLKGGDFTMVSLPGAEGAPKRAPSGAPEGALPGSLPFPFALSDRPEILEPAGSEVHSLDPGTIINGRIFKPGEVDRYKLAVAPGQPWFVELRDTTLGTSRLYGLLTVYDAKGKKLASAGDAGVEKEFTSLVSAADSAVDPYLAFKIPADVHEIAVTVEDLLGHGGPDYGYRLLAQKQPPDFTLTLATPFVNIPAQGTAVVAVTAERRGYMGPIDLRVPDLPDDLIADGGHIPAELGAQNRLRSARQGQLTITPKPGVKARVLELAVVGEGKLEDGEVLRRHARGPAMLTAIRGVNQKPFTAPWLGLELPAMVAKENPAALEVVSPRYVRLVQGMESDVQWKFVRRQPGLPLPRRVNGDNVPGVGNLRVVRRDSKEGGESGAMTLVTTVGTPPMKFDMVLDAPVTIDGREERITAPAITFDIVQGYTIEPPAKTLTLEPGGKAELAGRLRWEPAFSAPVTIKADNLPLQVSCRPAEAPSKAAEFRLGCEAGPSAAPGEYEIELNSSSTLAGKGQEIVPYSIPPVTAKLIVSGKPSP